MKKMKSLLALVFVLSLFVVALCFGADSAPSVYTHYDAKSRVLHVSGSGELKDLYVTEWVEEYENYEDDEDCMCNECIQLKVDHIVITGDVTSINHCFIGIHCVKSISLPDTVKEIKGGSFNALYDLKTVYLPKNLTVINNAFNQCNVEWIKLPEKIEVLCGFGGAQIKELEIPRTVKKLAVYSNTLERIYIPETVTASMLKATGHVNDFMEEEFGEPTFNGIHTKSKKLVVTGYDKSAAKDWAKENGHKFEQISPVPSKLSLANGDYYVRVTWSEVEKTDNWTLYRKAAGDKSWTKLGTFGATTTKYYDKSVSGCNTYTYRLMGDDNKIYLDAKIKRVVPPSKVIVYAKSATTATVKWRKVDGAKYYYVYKRTNMVQNGQNNYTYTKLARVDAKYNFYKVKNLKLEPGVFAYCIRVYDGTSYSTYSNAAEFESGRILITSCTANVKNNTITVKWPSSQGTVKNCFHVFYKEKDNSDVREIVTVNASKFKTSGNYHYVTFTPKNKLENFNGFMLEAETYYDSYYTAKPSEASRFRAYSNRVNVDF